MLKLLERNCLTQRSEKYLENRKRWIKIYRKGLEMLGGPDDVRRGLERTRTLDALADVALRAGIMALVFAKIASPSPKAGSYLSVTARQRHNR